MHLMKSTTSPFGRLAHAMLMEAGADFEVELLNPWADPAQLVALNPAKRVPTLRLDDGTVLTEAMVIAMHAADIAPEGSHLKANTVAHYAIVGMAVGVIEAAVNVMVGRKLTSDDLGNPEFDAHPVAERRRETMRVGLGALDARVGDLREDRMGLAEILVVDAVQYMDFRFPGAAWRPDIAALDAWIRRVSHHPSIRETVPS